TMPLLTFGRGGMLKPRPRAGLSAAPGGDATSRGGQFRGGSGCGFRATLLRAPGLRVTAAGAAFVFATATGRFATTFWAPARPALATRPIRTSRGTIFRDPNRFWTGEIICDSLQG